MQNYDEVEQKTGLNKKGHNIRQEKGGTPLIRAQNYDDGEKHAGSNKTGHIRQRKWHTTHACAKI